MRSCRLLPLLMLVALSLQLPWASTLALASPARSRKCRRALYLTKRGEAGDALLPRLWRNSELPVPLALNRRPPPRPAPAPLTSWSAGPHPHPRPPPPPRVSSILAGNASQAKTRRERKKEVAEKKKQYENIRAGRAFVDMILDECGSWLKKDLPSRSEKKGKSSVSGPGSSSGSGPASGSNSGSGPAVARLPL